MTLDPPIKVGDVVFVDLADIIPDISFVGKIFALTAGEGAAVEKGPDVIKSVALDRCHHASQGQKREYFKKILKDG
jgi:hypothetical protein